MRHEIGLVSATVIFLVLTSSYAIFAQEAPGPATAAQEPAVSPTPAPAEPETQWVWGEVASVDPQKNEIVVKYLDYETDQEKEMALAVDDKTTYENIKSLADIKLKDALSVDYWVGSEGKNIAKNISVEKAEAAGSVAPEEKVTTAQPEAKTETVQGAGSAQPAQATTQGTQEQNTPQDITAGATSQSQ